MGNISRTRDWSALKFDLGLSTSHSAWELNWEQGRVCCQGRGAEPALPLPHLGLCLSLLLPLSCSKALLGFLMGFSAGFMEFPAAGCHTFVVSLLSIKPEAKQGEKSWRGSGAKQVPQSAGEWAQGVTDQLWHTQENSEL